MTTLKQQQTKLILNKLKNIQTIATIMDSYFKPFDEFKKQKNYTIEEAINTKESQQKYLSKYGAFTLKTITKDIENILNDTP